jgi:acyl carrier protein
MNTPKENLDLTAVLVQLQRIIAEETGNELEDITPDSYLEDELGISQSDFRRLIIRVNKEFGIRLESNLLAEIETVLDLAVLIEDEAELG